MNVRTNLKDNNSNGEEYYEEPEPKNEVNFIV